MTTLVDAVTSENFMQYH